MLQRYPEIDVLRTVAILLMVVYHILFDLAYLYGFSIDLSTNFWHGFERMSASLFLLLVGVSFVLSYQRVATRPSHVIYRKYAVRGLRIVGWGLVISLVTYFFDPATYIRFGILHLIGVSILLLPLFYRYKEINFLIGIFFIYIGKYLNTIMYQSGLFLPVGLTYVGFSTLDYFPLFPWLGVVLMGMAVGHFFYVRFQRWRTKYVANVCDSRSIIALGYCGRHSLFIYLVHQPLILLVLMLFYGRPHVAM